MTQMTPPGLRPLKALLEFLRSERAGGLFLILASAAALVVANSSMGDGYRWLLDAHVGPMEAIDWVNDGLMALFFLLVGLELRNEVTEGQLSSPARLAAPGIGALGGMIAPALVYTAFNHGDPGAMRGWAVAVATDIAFALAVLGILGKQVPLALKVFLAALAVMDDLGAILVIAIFYSEGLNLWLLLLGAAVAGAMYGAGRLGVVRMWVYVVGGLALWVIVYRSGVHATLAGVVLAFVVPKAVADRMEHVLGSVVGFLVLPLFGFFNAGLSFAHLPAGAWRDTAGLGVALGLLFGKPLGVMSALQVSGWFGWTKRPAGVSTLQLWGGSILCGIGFTMSLFVADLAFGGGGRGDEVKLAIFIGSLISALLGLAVLAIASGRLKSPAARSSAAQG